MADQVKRPGTGSRLPTFSTKKTKLSAEAGQALRIGQQSHSSGTGKRTMSRSASNSSIKSNDSGITTRAKPAGSKALFTVGTNRINKPAVVATSVKSGFSVSKKPPASKPTNTKTSSTPTSTATTAAPAAKKPKRAAWDTKGQLLDMQSDMAAVHQRLAELETEKENEREQLLANKQEAVTTIQADLTGQIEELRSKYLAEMADLRGERDRFEVEQNSLTRQNKSLQAEISAFSDKIDSLQAELRVSQKEAAALRLDNREMKLDLDDKNKKVATLSSDLSQCRSELLTAQEVSRQHETDRRRLHNTIQELKGNIRVYCRVRPPVGPNEVMNPDVFSYPDLDHKKVVLTQPLALNASSLSDTMRTTKPIEFAFDRVFEPESNQAEVFEEISQLVQSALDGYNVCIFAYGQTGSGKTYTMQGPDELTSDTEGMIPRSIHQIFRATQQLEDQGWKYKLAASFLEIYNETLQDLLATNSTPEDTKYEIKTASGEVEVTHLTIVEVNNPHQVGDLFERAKKNRHTAETCINARSSRSHSVFQLKITGENSLTGESSSGTLSLVDLAGSERLKDSKAQGDRLKETQNINSSLSTLGNVIMALAARKSHIPYRDSKLTYLLQNSLGGNSKTLMFVNLSPRDEHFNETVNSLRFATKVNNCTIGTAQKSVKPTKPREK